LIQVIEDNMQRKFKYHCPYSDGCSYASILPKKQRYQIIEKEETEKPVFKDKEIKRNEYKCNALKNLDVGCSWIEHLNMSNLGMAMAFTSLKNTHCIAYSLKMTEDKD
jgi:hypothetical protein